jgi:hypothetical protein
MMDTITSTEISFDFCGTVRTKTENIPCERTWFGELLIG